MKRKAADLSPNNDNDDGDDWPTASTPKRQRTGPGPHVANNKNETDAVATTPSKRARATPKKVATPNPTGLKTPTHKSKATSLFLTPKKSTPSRAKNADRSAKRKSAKLLLEQDEDDVWDGADRLAEEILGDEEAANGAKDTNVLETTEKQYGEKTTKNTEPQPKRRAGRPKGAKNKRSPTPEGEIPPHERYFFQNRAGPPKTSNNTLNKVSLLTHEEYFELLGRYQDPFAEEKDLLLAIHQRSFPQWNFEFRENFNICLYGYGSKRRLVQQFADWLYKRSISQPIIIVNGHTPNITARAILNTIVTSVCGDQVPAKLGTMPSEVLEFLHSALQSRTAPVTVLINSIDAPPLRRTAIYLPNVLLSYSQYSVDIQNALILKWQGVF